MAYMTFLNRNGKNMHPYECLNPLETIEKYIMDSRKAKHNYIGAGVLMDDDFVGCMNIISAFYGETEGAQVYHFVITFLPSEVNDPKIACDIAQQICNSLSVEYQVCFAVHEDTENLHVHFVFNSRSYLDGDVYHATKEEIERLFKFVARLIYYCSEIDVKLVHPIGFCTFQEENNEQ